MSESGKALAGLLADLAAGFGREGDQTALIITEVRDSERLCVVVLMGSGPEHDAAVAAYQSPPANSNSTDSELRAAS
jgi:hypothetical protein